LRIANCGFEQSKLFALRTIRNSQSEIRNGRSRNISLTESLTHRHLGSGIELGLRVMPSRPVVALRIRVFAGYALESAEHLGVTSVLTEAITKGTAKRTGRELNDAFDEIGAAHGVTAGRESVSLTCLCLPEYFPRAVELQAELLRTPTFPDDACAVAVELAEQCLAALEDDPGDLTSKLLHRQAYGGPLGRHKLGEPETLARIGRDRIVEHWRRYFAAARMQVAVAGAVDPEATTDLFEGLFDGFGDDGAVAEEAKHAGNRPTFTLEFQPGRSHHAKELEQEHVAICFPGAAVTDPVFPVETVLVAVLSGGMSGRLFSEVREKQGLVYWVGAWADHPRNGGMLHLGASTTPQRVDKTYATLLREIDRVGEDLTEDEVQRAIVGIVARTQTRGDITRSKASELSDDLFYRGRPIPTEEKLDKIRAVTVDDIRRYLDEHPRDRLSVVTLGPREMESH
jgi:predicted Zn-dependent peptidase